MAVKTRSQRRPDPVRQFSVFAANRLGRLHDIVALFAASAVNVLALTVLDTTDSVIIRLILDDPDRGRDLLVANDFAFTESEMIVIELTATQDLKMMMAALLAAELNIHYLYAFIPHLQDRSLVALSMEDNELAEQVLHRRHFKVLRQADISR